MALVNRRSSKDTPQLPRAKILAVGALINGGINQAGDRAERRIEAAYAHKMSSATPRENPLEVSKGQMATAKGACVVAKGFNKAAGGAVKVMDHVAGFAGAAAAKKGGSDGVVGQCAVAYADVQKTLHDRGTAAVNKAADLHLDYTEKVYGKDAAKLSYYVGSTAKNATSGALKVQKVVHPASGMAKGVAKQVVKNKVLGR